MKTYSLLLKIQSAVLRVIKEGITEEYPWQVAVNLLGSKSKYFIHGLGHGIGLNVHEAPYLRKGMTNTIKSGNAITVEPGLYYPGWGGIRIEDYIIVTKKGCRVLSKMTKSLDDMII